MEKINIKNKLFLLLFFGAMITAMISSCKKENYPILTSGTLNITQYLEADPAQYSLFDQIVERSGYAGFLGAYGAYTLFAPNNAGVTAYLKKINKTTVDQIDANTCKDIVKLHLIQDTITTAQFTDGKLQSITMYGQYLLTGATNVNGVTKITINRQANMVKANIKVGNGIIHTIDNVLTPATLTIAQMIEQNPKYSIYTQALKQTGYYDTLNVSAITSTNVNQKFFTVFAESDSVFNAAGISSYTALAKKYSTKGNPKDPADSLHLFMAYHTVADIKYLADVATSPSLSTLAPQEVITTSLNGTNILLNETTFNNVFEPGVLLNRTYSDNSATNGVLHAANTNFTIKVRQATAVYWDIADQPELRKQTSFFRKNGKSLVIPFGFCAGITWDKPAYSIAYTCDATTSTNYFVYYDHIDFPLRFGNAGVINWVEFTTPLLVKGQYKVWICYRNGVLGQNTQISVDGNPLPRILNLGNSGTGFNFPDVTYSGDVLESLGYKRYSAAAPLTNNNQISQLAGTVNILTTNKHQIRFTAIKDGGNGATNGVTIDMIHFIPVSQDQQYPQFNRDGSLKTR